MPHSEKLFNVLTLIMLLLFRTVCHGQEPLASDDSIVYQFKSSTNKYVGLMNSKGQILKKPNDYPKILWINDNSSHLMPALIEDEAGLKSDLDDKRNYCYLDYQGRIKIPPLYSDARGFHEGLALVKLTRKIKYKKQLIEKERSVFIDYTGKIVIENDTLSFEGDFHSGLAVISTWGAKTGQKFGYINTKGEIVIRPQFDRASNFSCGRALVVTNRSAKYIDRNGAIVLDDDYELGKDFSNYLAAVHKHGGYSYIDTQGNVVIQNKFEAAYAFSSGIALVEPNDAPWHSTHDSDYFYINKKGENLFNRYYYDARGFSNGFAAVQYSKDSQWVYINTKGERVFNKKFLKAQRFNGDLAIVQYENKENAEKCTFETFGYINSKGESVLKWSRPKPVTHIRGGAHHGVKMNTVTDPPVVEDVVVNSNPQKAKIYLVPLDIWEDDSTIVNNTNKLETFLQSSYSNCQLTSIYCQVYIVILELNGRKIKRKIDVFKGRKNVIDINFTEG